MTGDIRTHTVEAALRREIRELRIALKEAIDTIHTWHGDIAWDIYYEHSPEMKRIRAPLLEKFKVDSGREI